MELWLFKVKDSMHFVEQKFNFNKNQKELKMEILTQRIWTTWTWCFSSFENRKLTVKLWRVGARERKTRAFFVPLHLCFISMHSVVNTLSEYTYSYILKSKNINSYTCCLFLKSSNPFSVSLACLLYLCLINYSIQVFLEF